MCRGTGPFPILGAFRKACTDRIEFGIAQCLPKMSFVKRTRVVSPLPDVPAGMLDGIPIRGKSPMRVFECQSL